MAKKMKVGLFVLFGLTLMAIGIFLIGENRHFWDKKITYRAAFRDVAGLKPGAPVRTGGLDIGSVTSVKHAEDPGDPRIYVTFAVVRDEAPRLREDTVASVENKGFLGDKMINLSVSTSNAPPQDPSKLMQSQEPRDMLADANALAAQAKQVVARLEPLAQSLGDPQLGADIKGSVSSTHKIMDAVANQDSVAHRLLFDPEEARKLDVLLTNMSNASYHLDGIAADVHDVTTHAKQGPGIVHALVYDGDMSQSAAGTMAELHQDLKAIREGNGLAHALLYGDDSTQHMMGNLNQMSDDLRDIVAGIKQGKGTIGGLLVDPTIYEDLKAAVGNVERNEVLRALVRYSIKADEEKPHVSTPPPTPPAPQTGGTR